MFRCKIADISIEIGLWFPAMAVLMLTLDESALTVHCLLASAIHEGGHFLTMLCCGDRPRRLVFDGFGVRVERETGNRLSYTAAAAVSLSGPFTNLLCAAMLCIFGGLTEGVLVHMIIGGFHLLPISSLDGGEALYSLLCCRMTEEKAHRVLLWLSIMVLLPLSAVGFFLLFDTGYNISLLVLTVYLILLLIFKEKR